MRYLFFISYIGTSFRGAQRSSVQRPLIVKGKEYDTVEETLEKAIRVNILLNKEARVVLSSRTDAGTHAIRSAVHVDLRDTHLGRPFYSADLIKTLNRYFQKNEINLRIQDVYPVPDSFHCRYSATSRQYLYRLAIEKLTDPERCRRTVIPTTPMSELNRTYFCRKGPFDVDKAKETVKLFVGKKDFACFMARFNSQEGKKTELLMYESTLCPGQPLLPGFDDRLTNLYDFWNFTFTGRSFLYNQVRRMVAVTIAVATGRIELEDVQRMFDDPRPENWPSRVAVVPPYGLYLLSVNYDFNQFWPRTG